MHNFIDYAFKGQEYGMCPYFNSNREIPKLAAVLQLKSLDGKEAAA
jgi:hypothetical protein